jgi:hypothetical protein
MNSIVRQVSTEVEEKDMKVKRVLHHKLKVEVHHKLKQNCKEENLQNNVNSH